MPKEVRGGSHKDVGEASRYPNVDYKYREALAALDKKIIEAKVALDKEHIEAKAALKEESTEALAALDKKFTEAKVALDKEHIEAKVKLKESTKVTLDGKGFPHLYESHHVYAHDAYKKVFRPTEVSRDDGPAIRMDVEDHKKTSSCGSLDDAKTYRKAQSDLLKQGKFGEAWMKDVEDIRSKFGDKYDEHLVKAEAQLLKLHDDPQKPIQLDPQFKQELEERQEIYNRLANLEDCKTELKKIYDERQNEYVQKQKQDFNNAMSQWEKIRNTEIANGKDYPDAVYAANADLYFKVTGKNYNATPNATPEELSSVLPQRIEAYYITDCKKEFEERNSPNNEEQQQKQSQGVTY